MPWISAKWAWQMRLPRPVSFGTEWAICTWTMIVNEEPLQEEFVQLAGWVPGEHALVGSAGNDQHIFLGEADVLGCFCQDLGTKRILI